ncbi:glycosyltransferase family 2 protein [Myroides indicus]|uniref:Glycosyltransferase involved in cell wall biosynthesis n=1 Tax=Myroides indicus TaxID=1323422 RepID=A0A4R7EZP5_9FLAO|nr:glycosyltransferase family 2 protein [Myroides indicus]TDS58131.1 glycosyltransferase involved in cell wall biosynthesis [Myroides indicus]
MKIKVSVIIPCYNCAETIHQCVESAVNQTYSVHEIILVNDGSTDNTLEKLDEIHEKYKEAHLLIKIISQTNQGPSAARNRGIEESTGDWIAFLDSDDYWFEDKTEIQLRGLQTYPDSVLIGGKKGLRKKEIILKKVSVVNFLKLCFKNFFLTSSTMVNARVAKNYKFNIHQKHSEDYRFFLEILADKFYGITIDLSLSCSIANKRDYGEAGLSQNIFKMEKGELSNFKYLFEQKKISFMKYVGFSLFSILKFFRRWIIINILS